MDDWAGAGGRLVREADMVRIIADTTCGLPRDLFPSLGIPLIPQIVVFGEESFRDDTELDTAAFLQKLKASHELPKTAAPPPTLYHAIFEQALRDGEEVVVVAPSAKLSGTVRSAEVAAQEFPGLRVHVVDTQTVAGDLGTLVLLAHQWAGQGLEAEEIVRRLQACSRRSRTYFMVATLEYLQKGGRIGGARALLGELLQVKPILCVREGQVEAYEQQRTKRRAVARLMELAREQAARGPEGHLCVMHAEAISDATMLVRELKGALDLSEVPIYEMPPAIVVHGGPGILAVGFFVPETPMV
jgi:DegV family protein with EDD domain